MKKFFQLFVITGILGSAALVAFILWKKRPEAIKKETKVVFLSVVEVLPVKLETLSIEIPSQGIVESARRSMIASEIAGKVVSVSDKFNAGEVFAKDEIILSLDSSDYDAALAQTEATLAEAKATSAEAKVTLATEESRSKQAEIDWERLGNGGTPGDLTLRGPQLRSANARVAAADASVIAADAAVKKANKDRARTSIRAPFPAAITRTKTEIGSYLTPGAQVAEVFQTSPFEIRLPLSIDEMQFLKLNAKGEPEGDVEISTTAAGITSTWDAKIIRTEREVDRSSRSVYVVAKIASAPDKEGIVLQPGLFVEAKIAGRSFSNIAKIPFRAFLDLKQVVVVDPDNKLRFREVTLLRREGENVFVSGGLKKGEQLCMTERPGMIEGSSVTTRPWQPDATPPVAESITKP